MNNRVGSIVAIVALLATFAVAGATASPRSSRAPELALGWLAPTPADGKAFVVEVGAPLSVSIAATPNAVVTARGLPAGASLRNTPDGLVLKWVPTAAGVGPHVVVLSGHKPGTQLYTPSRTLFLYGAPARTTAGTSQTTVLATPGISRWAYVIRPAVVRSQPSTSAHVVARLSTETLDKTPNLVLTLASTKDAAGRTWYQVRLPVLPNNSTGWVLWGALDYLKISRTYLVVDRALFVATLYRNGVPIFKTRVGVGRPYWPTPRGDFYVREVLTGFTDPMYGPIAFGTSARSSVLTDWHGGGGVIGIHGTDQPEILPGRVSHGCVRMPNASVRRLYRLMGVGTPVAIR